MECFNPCVDQIIGMQIWKRFFNHLWIFVPIHRLDQVKQYSKYDIFETVDHVFIEFFWCYVGMIGNPLSLELLNLIVSIE